MPPTTARNPFPIFQTAVTEGVHDTISECLRDFAHWEHARQFADDPSHPAKAAIEWILAWEELCMGLDEFAGSTKHECVRALDRAGDAFARLDHSAELLRAVERWLAERRRETQSPQ